mgnify:CR=1 FL=1
MTHRHLVTVLLAVLLLAVSLLPLAAQAQEPSVGVRIEQSSQTSPEEKLRYSAQALDGMRAMVEEVAQLVGAAEREKNMAAIQCFARKLTTMRALLEVSESSVLLLQQALADGKLVTAEHEYRKIAVASSKVQQFRAEAAACDGGGGGEERVTVELLSSPLSSEDETAPPVFTETFGDQPLETSPFQ